MRRTPNAVRDARERAGVTQLELALRSGISVGTISVAERGGRLSARAAGKLASVLGVGASDLTSPATNPDACEQRAAAGCVREYA